MSDTEYTPTTEEVREAYATPADELFPLSEGHPERVKKEAEFDRWLAARDERVRAEQREVDAQIVLTAPRARATPRLGGGDSKGISS